MWRAFFLGIGITLAILGGECLLVEKAVFAFPGKKEPPKSAFPGSEYLPGGEYLSVSKPASGSTKELEMPDWAPWALLSAGAVVAIYSVTVAKA